MADNIPELLKCPFAHLVKSDPPRLPYATNEMDEDSQWCVYCPTCSASSGFFAEKASAIWQWNARVHPDREGVVEGLVEALTTVTRELDEMIVVVGSAVDQCVNNATEGAVRGNKAIVAARAALSAYEAMKEK